MRYLPLLAILLPSLAAAQTNPLPKTRMPVSGKPSPHCEAPDARQVGNTRRPGAQKLNALPPARPIYTVVREIDGCPIPVSVRPQ